MVYKPRWRASASAVSRLGELPLVDIAMAMSPVFARAINWRANTSSNPTSLPSAVTIAWSAVNDHAGKGFPAGGRQNKAANVVESVQLPPFPKVNIRPPAAKRRAISPAARPSGSALAFSVVRRSARLSPAFACADAARSASSDCGLSSCASMNGYRKSVGSSVMSAALPRKREVPPPHRCVVYRRRRGPLGVLLDAADRGAGVHQYQLTYGDRVDQRSHHVLDAPRSAHCRHPFGRCRHHLAQASLVTACDANLFGTFGFEQSRVLETHMGQFPQQVVEQHKATRRRDPGIGVVEPQNMVRHTGFGPLAVADHDRGGAPGRAAAHHRAHSRVIGASDRDEDVAGLYRPPHQID